jgi:hypothetical protein
MKRLVLLASLFLLATGCGFLSGGITSSDPFMSHAERRLQVRVDNSNGMDMSVRAISAGRSVEMGRVRARSVQQFSIPWPGPQEVRFQVEPLGGRRHTTNGIPARPGEFVNLVITQPVERSFVRR